MPRLTPANKELHAAEMREKICRTFAELFAVDGEVSMDRLAETVGVAKGTIYNYFKDKSELITAVMETRRVIMVELMERTIPPDAPPEDNPHAFPGAQTASLHPVVGLDGLRGAQPLFLHPTTVISSLRGAQTSFLHPRSGILTSGVICTSLIH